MALSTNQAKQIIDVVAADPTCNFRINSWLKVLPSSLGAAGGTRNFYYMLFGDDVSEPGSLSGQLDCNAIAIATSAAIATKATKDSAFPVKTASRGARVGTETQHEGTFVTMKDGSIYVFDWHATLNPLDPLIFASETNFNKSNGVPFSQFKGF